MAQIEYTYMVHEDGKDYLAVLLTLTPAERAKVGDAGFIRNEAPVNQLCLKTWGPKGKKARGTKIDSINASQKYRDIINQKTASRKGYSIHSETNEIFLDVESFLELIDSDWRLGSTLSNRASNYQLLMDILKVLGGESVTTRAIDDVIAATNSSLKVSGWGSW